MDNLTIAIILLTLSLLVTQVLDYRTTTTILANGGRELNPVMAKLFEIAGIKPVLIAKGVFVMALGYYVGTQSIELLFFICLAYVVVIHHNYKEMQK